MNGMGTNGGERLSRRPVLALLAAAGLAPSLRPRATSRAWIGEECALDLAGFLASAVPTAKQLIGDTSRAGQDRYLHALAALAVCLRDVPIPEMRETGKEMRERERRETGVSSTARTFLGANECEAPFTVLHWRMEPGSRIGLHPHIYGNVVTLCLEGELRIQNYEMEGARDFDTREPFTVRRSRWIPGVESSL